jgi:membrane complex biogenesis BtpA family protein
MKSHPVSFRILFEVECPVIAMIHVQALPGTPAYEGSMSAIVEQARKEARLYQALGVDGIILENMHDTPYLNRTVGHEISTAMAVVASAARSEFSGPMGLQVLAGANKAALAAALASGAEFIRAEGFVFGHVADEGWMSSDAGELLRYREQIGAGHIGILTDIKKKHSAHAVTADVDLVETAKAAEFFRSDGVIVTGSSTGQATSPEEVIAVRDATILPVLVGSGVTPDNLKSVFQFVDGVIVGSWLKENGDWQDAPDEKRVAAMMEAVQLLRQ